MRSGESIHGDSGLWSSTTTLPLEAKLWRSWEGDSTVVLLLVRCRRAFSDRKKRRGMILEQQELKTKTTKQIENFKR